MWGMYSKKNVDFVSLLRGDFMFQADNREISFAHKENMPYPRFTKVIINHFISKDKTNDVKNWINIHTVHNDTLLATPKKARKFKKIASPSNKLSLVLEEEPIKKPKRSKKPAKKPTIVPTAGVVIIDTPGESVSKKKAPTKVDRGKGMDLLSKATLLEVAQLKKTLKKSKMETHKLHASGSGDGVGSQPKVPDEQQDKTTGIDEGADDDSNDDDSDDVTNDDDDDVDSDADGDNEASDNEKTNFDEDDNLNLNQNKDDEEEYDEEYVHTPDNYELYDDEEEYEELYKDINIRLKDAEHEEEEGNGDAEMTNVGRDDGTHQTTYEYVKDDEHVILTTVHDIQKTEVPFKIAKAEKPPLTFNELMSTPIDFSAYVINNLKIDNLTQEQFVGPVLIFLKEYPFDLSKPLPLIEDRGIQVVHVNYFINHNLKYLKGGSSSRKYMTSTTKTKVAKHDDIQVIKDMVPSL
nr:hypothetical protein [Tanacetum cinerariifolium]